jgi:hypothetical protein
LIRCGGSRVHRGRGYHLGTASFSPGPILIWGSTPFCSRSDGEPVRPCDPPLDWGCSRSSWRRAMSHPGYGGTGGSCRAANAISAHRGRRRRRKACLRPAQKRASQPNPCPRFNSRALSGVDVAPPWPAPSCQAQGPPVYPVLPQNSRSRSPALRQRPASAERFGSGGLERRPSVSADRDTEASVPGSVLA